METPIVSIIIPVYNGEIFIKRCIESICNQKIGNLEIICIDDASVDLSWRRLKEMAEADSRIKVYRNDRRKGQSYSRNRGLQYALGEFVWFIDADDSIQDDVLETMVKTARLQKLDVLHFQFSYEGIWASKKSSPFPESLVKEVMSGQTLFTKLVQFNLPMVSVCLNLIRRSFLLEYQIRFTEDVYCEDILYMYDLMYYARRCLCRNENIYIYCVRENSTSTQKPEERHIRGCLDAMTGILKRIARIPEKTSFVYASYAYLKRTHDYYLTRFLYRMDHLADMAEWSPDQIDFYQMMVQSFCFIDLDVINSNYMKISNEAPVYLFGAGEGCVQLLQILRERNVSVKGILVSSLKHNPEAVYGYPVMKCDNLCAERNRLVIIAVSNQYRDEAVLLLKQQGYTNML